MVLEGEEPDTCNKHKSTAAKSEEKDDDALTKGSLQQYYHTTHYDKRPKFDQETLERVLAFWLIKTHSRFNMITNVWTVGLFLSMNLYLIYI